MPTQILITGATGFIGRQLTHDLVSQGENVRILARNEAKAQKLFGNRVEIHPGDLSDPNSLKAACRGARLIYHIAGVYRFGYRHKPELWRINVEGAESLFREAARSGVAKVVHLSSGGVLKKSSPNAPGDQLLNEDDYPVHPPRFSSYKLSKWQAEKRALLWAKRGLPIVIASTTCPIGAGDEAPTPTGRMVLDFLRGRFPFYCRTALNLIDVRDLSQGLQTVSRMGQPGRRYLLSHENLWLKDILHLLSRECNTPAPQWCLPNWLIQIAACGGEVADYLNPQSTGARVCWETADQAKNSRFFDNTRTKAELGWKCQFSTKESIAAAVAWYQRILQEAGPSAVKGVRTVRPRRKKWQPAPANPQLTR